MVESPQSHQFLSPIKKKTLFKPIVAYLINDVTPSRQIFSSYDWQYLNVFMVHWYIDKCRKALAEPHSDLSVHVDSERLKAFLEATHGVVLKGACIFAQVHTANLGESKTANWDKA